VGNIAGQPANCAGRSALVVLVHDRPAGRTCRDWPKCELPQAPASSRVYEIDEGGLANLPPLCPYSAKGANTRRISPDLHDALPDRGHRASVPATIRTAESAAQLSPPAAPFGSEPLQTGSILRIQVSRESLHSRIGTVSMFSLSQLKRRGPWSSSNTIA